jgi:undecaprenyl diphosphate synthase
MDKQKLLHMGIIPDGARRWARKNGKSYDDAYWVSMTKLVDIIDVVFDTDVQIQSIYLLSKENLKRTETDLESVLRAEEGFIRKLLPDIMSKWGFEVCPAGSIELLPSFFREAVINLSIESKKLARCGNRKLYLLLAYNPWDEILHALKLGHDINKLREFFWITEDVDMIIRTGYGQLISNFLPLQSGYAELVFIDKLFNDIEMIDIVSAIHNFPKTGNRLLGI